MEHQDKVNLELAILKLSVLTREEYKMDFQTLISGLKLNQNKEILKFNRLIGVMLKEPFSTSIPRLKSSNNSGAYKSWAWEPQRIKEHGSSQLWQYQVLKKMFEEEYNSTPSDSELIQFLKTEGKTESRLTLLLFKSIQKHLCGNKAAEKKISEAIKKISESGISIVNPTPQSLIGLASMGILTAVTASVPNGIIFGPIAGGISLLILQIGLDTFCEWIKLNVEDLKSIEEKEQKRTDA